jgi:hypothetical protein
MRLRGKEPEWSSVIALPDFPRYRDLYAETSGSLAAAQIAVWWVSADGGVQASTKARWYARPDGESLVLRKAPRLANWNKSTDPDQIRLREYLEDTADLTAPANVAGPWALLLDVGLPAGRDIVDMADLDNCAFPLATHLRTDDLVSVWCSKRRGETSRVVAPCRQRVPMHGLRGDYARDPSYRQ